MKNYTDKPPTIKEVYSNDLISPFNKTPYTDALKYNLIYQRIDDNNVNILKNRLGCIGFCNEKEFQNFLVEAKNF